MIRRFIRPLAVLAALAVVPLGTTLAVDGPGTASIGPIVIERGWAREAPPGARASGGYATIRNTGDAADRLVAASAAFAERVELHEMSVVDGTMRMREVEDGLAVEPGASVTLEPGGLHLMFLDIADPPAAGDTVSVTLRFERAGEATLELPVAPIGAASFEAAR